MTQHIKQGSMPKSLGSALSHKQKLAKQPLSCADKWHLLSKLWRLLKNAIKLLAFQILTYRCWSCCVLRLVAFLLVAVPQYPLQAVQCLNRLHYCCREDHPIKLTWIKIPDTTTHLDFACITQYIIVLKFCLFNLFSVSFCLMTLWCEGFVYTWDARFLSINFSSLICVFRTRMAFVTFPLTTTAL